MPWPNGVLIVIVGRQTAEKSTWPQGCGMYQAATTSGAVAFSGLATAPKGPAGIVGSSLRRWRYTPAPGDQISVSGLSAATDRAPSRPYPASGWVQRICGTRDGPPPPIRPPNSRLSMPASESLKFELAWPNSNGPRVP